MNTDIHQARWVLPVSSPPIENGIVTVAQGRVTDVRAKKVSDQVTVDHGDATLLPGFVNAHTHLELTFCRGQVPFDGSFVGWVRRLQSFLATEGSPEARAASLAEGLAQSLRAGVTAVADIGYGGGPLNAWASSPMHVLGLLETLGMGAKRNHDHAQSIERLIDLIVSATTVSSEVSSHVSDLKSEISNLKLGISPHAPYSTSPEVFDKAIEFASTKNLLIATHLAETMEEVQFLKDGTGPFRELLESLGLWDGSFAPPGCSPIEYAESLGLLALRPILAHVNYATDADLDRLARCRAHVVYCPRTHRFFGHEPHRYKDMLARGINVCVGTDSLASGDSLSVLEELRWLRRMDRETPHDELLKMGTVRGATALRWDDEIGTLGVGKRADFVVISLDDPGTDDPCSDLLDTTARPLSIWIAGKHALST